jgi:hypothetical protein
MIDHEEIIKTVDKEIATAGLTEKQCRFIREYLKVLNGSEAARRAGYSVKCAYQQAYENLRKPDIKRIIDIGLNLETRACLIKARIIGPDEEVPEEFRWGT